MSTLAELFYLLPTEGVKILPLPFSRQSGSPDCLTLQFTQRDGGLSAYWWDSAIYGYTSLEPVHRHQGSPYLPATPEAPNRPTRSWSGFWPMLSVADAGFSADAVGYEFSLTVFSARRAFGGL